MKLYYDPISTACRPVMMFAADHGLDLDLELVDLMSGQHHSEAYAAINPNQLVPWLIDGDLAIGEVSAILKYLADKTESATYPRDLRQRARVNAAMDWFNTQFHRAFCDFVVYPQVLPPDHLPDADCLPGLVRYGTTHAPRWLGILDRAMIGDRRFVCGDTITLADYLGAAFVTLGELVRYDFSPYPNVCRWLATLKVRAFWTEANAGFNGWLTSIHAHAA